MIFTIFHVLSHRCFGGGIAFGQFFRKTFTKLSVITWGRIPITSTQPVRYFNACRGHSIGISNVLHLSCMTAHEFFGDMAFSQFFRGTFIESFVMTWGKEL